MRGYPHNEVIMGLFQTPMSGRLHISDPFTTSIMQEPLRRPSAQHMEGQHARAGDLRVLHGASETLKGSYNHAMRMS